MRLRMFLLCVLPLLALPAQAAESTNLYVSWAQKSPPGGPTGVGLCAGSPGPCNNASFFEVPGGTHLPAQGQGPFQVSKAPTGGKTEWKNLLCPQNQAIGCMQGNYLVEKPWPAGH